MGDDDYTFNDTVDLKSGPPKHLYAKLAQVSGAMHRLRKRGHNNFHKYNYVTAEDISDTVREELAKRNVAFLPSIESFSQETNESIKTNLKLRFIFACGDSGETTECQWFSESIDKGDKGINKAATAATKYFLMKTFLISSGDEIDADAESHDVTEAVKPKSAREKIMAASEEELFT